MLFSEIAKAVERGEFDAGVLIHEGRFVYERENLELIADLGLEWERREGLPLPLGSIVAARDLEEGVAERFEALLRESIAYAFAHPEVSRNFIKSHAQEMEDSVIDRHIALFVNEFSLTLGDEGREAVRRLIG
jgi:1,4-dihydroxy-6-naphthoate synthase